jgi:hypothetical protein
MLKINNIDINQNIIFSKDGENIIYTKDYREEFFNIYNIKYLNESILCESKSKDYVNCEVNRDGKIYENIPFKIKKSNEEKIVINELFLCENFNVSEFIIEEKEKDIMEIIREDFQKEKELIDFRKKINNEKKVLLEKQNCLKNEYNNLLKDTGVLKQQISNLNLEKKKLIEEKDEYVLNYQIDKLKRSILDDLKKEFVKENGNLINESKENKTKKLLIEENLQDINKKVELFENKISALDKTNTKTQNLIQTLKSYTDSKVSQALNESRKYTRIMMDFVGGGSGSVAVQLAGGGKIEGGLQVTDELQTGKFGIETLTLSGIDVKGDINVEGSMSANVILSGGQNITEIFAGEGEGDTNTLDGGLV